MRKRLYGILCLTSVCLIAIALGGACAPLEKESTRQGSKEQDAISVYEGVMPNELPEHITAELEAAVTLDATLDVSKELTDYQLKKIVLTRHILEGKNEVERFLAEQGNLVVKERRSSPKEDEYLENGKAMEAYIAELEDGWVQCRELYFTFSHHDENVFDICYIDETEGGSYLYRVPGETELGFVSLEEAKRKFQESLAVFQIENLLEPEVFTFTADILQEAADENYKNAKDMGDEIAMEKYSLTFSEEDGYYYIRMKQGVQGVPLYYLQGVNETMSGTYYNLPNSVECVYGKDGITNLNITGLFDIMEEGEMEIESFYDMLNLFCSTHGSLETTVKYIGLSYLPMVKDGSKLEFHGQPVWYFVYDEVSKGLTSRNVAIYNAETGEIIK